MINYRTSNILYSRVCGRISAYARRTLNGFVSFNDTERPPNSTIEDNYVDGVSLTHGNPRQHIWTFAANKTCLCPLNNSPRFVMEHYFCDIRGSMPLWDGVDCGSQNTCCSFNNPPWFYRQLPQPTTDAIEMRVCTNGGPTTNEDVAIEIIEIYVQ